MIARGFTGLAGFIVCVVSIGGCAVDKPQAPSLDQKIRWIGVFESSLGLLGCPARGPMTIEVVKEAISGEAQAEGFIMSVSGKLGQNGAVLDGVFRRDKRAAAIFTGTFLERDAAGRWQGASCEGVWSLRRVSG